MARLPAVAAVLSDAVGIDRPAGDSLARLLREAELIAPGGKRGLGAAHLTVRDAANMFLGFCAPVIPARAAEAAALFGSLPVLRPVPRHDASAYLPAPVFAATTFGGAIEALIDNALDIDARWDALSASEAAADPEPWPAGFPRPYFALEVEMRAASSPEATIRVKSLHDKAERRDLHRLTYITQRVGSYRPVWHVNSTYCDIEPFVRLARVLAGDDAESQTVG